MKAHDDNNDGQWTHFDQKSALKPSAQESATAS